MIVTAKKQIPTRWVLLAILPWATFTFNSGVVGVAFLFSLKKFIENPAGLTFILSLPNFISLVAGPVASFLSDRVWTRVGRRKPFIIASWSGMVVGMLLMPIAPNVWTLLAAYILWQTASAIGSPIEPLKQEIIPPAQRGFATGAMTWLNNLATVTFYFIMLGRFDDVTYMSGFPISGEKVMYWSGALLLAVMIIIVVLGIRETDPKSELRGQRFTWRNIIGGLADHELRPVYLLVITSSFLNYYGGLGALSNLLYTDQWGYTKQEMGVNVAVGGVFNIFAIGALTALADRLNRMRAYQTVLCLLTAANAAYYCYVQFVLPDQHPTLVEIIVFGETISMLAILSGLLYTPLIYDYVRRNKMGTYGAGSGIISRIASIITLNGVGLFVYVYATLVQPPAGEMTRVVLKQDTDRPQLLAALSGIGNGKDLSAKVWQATGVTSPTGQTWEIRQRDKDSEHLTAGKTDLETARADRTQHDTDGRKTNVDDLNQKIAAIDTTLTNRADAFRGRVAAALGGRIIADGDQLLAVHIAPAMVIVLPTTRRADDRDTEKMLDALRQDPWVIDMHPVMRGGRFALAGSVLLRDGAAADAAVQETAAHALQAAMEQAAQKDAPGLLVPGAAALDRAVASALTLQIATVEEPVESYVSPVTRVVNTVYTRFNHAAVPTHRLIAIGRNLKSPTETDQTRVTLGPTAHGLTVTAILDADTAAKAVTMDDPVSQRMRTLIHPNGFDDGMLRARGDLVISNDELRQARAFYDQIATAAAAQRITVARPLLATAYAPMQYDYMSGYLWMFVMSAVGILLTVVFVRLERRGIVRKYGVEEAEATT